MSIYSVYNTFPVRPTPVHMNPYDNIQENTVLQSVILEQGFLNYKLISFQSSVTKVLRLKNNTTKPPVRFGGPTMRAYCSFIHNLVFCLL